MSVQNYTVTIPMSVTKGNKPIVLEVPNFHGAEEFFNSEMFFHYLSSINFDGGFTKRTAIEAVSNLTVEGIQKALVVYADEFNPEAA